MPPKVKSDSFTRIILSFVGAVVLIALLTILLALPKAELVVIASPSQQQLEFELPISSSGGASLGVRFWQAQENGTTNLEPTGDAVERDARAAGTITIINESSSEQILVATTRFLTPDNVLLRLDNRVVIPRQSEIEAQITADEPGRSGNIAKDTRLAIPGLSSARQEQVYGETKAALTGGVLQYRIVAETDLARAKTQLLSELREQAKVSYLAQLIEDTIDSPDQALITPHLLSRHEVLSESADAKAGDEVTVINYTMSVELTGIAYNEKDLEELVRARLINSLQAGEELTSLANIEVKLLELEYNDSGPSFGKLKLITTFSDLLSEPQGLVDTFDLGGLTKTEVEAFFATTQGVELKLIKLSPFWTKQVPHNTSRVHIKLDN